MGTPLARQDGGEVAPEAGDLPFREEGGGALADAALDGTVAPAEYEGWFTFHVDASVPEPAQSPKTAAVPKAPSPKTARGEATRRAILDAAQRVIGTVGFNDASITAITREARVASGTFYIYFRSKEEVFEALVLDMGRSLRRALTAATEGASDRLAAEKAVLRAFLAFVIAHPSLYRIIREALFVAPAVYRAYFQSFADGYREGLAAAAARGEIRPGDDETRAWMLIGISVTLGERYVVFGETRPVEELVEGAHAMILHGLTPGERP